MKGYDPATPGSNYSSRPATKTLAVAALSPSPVWSTTTWNHVTARLADYRELIRPRIALMVLVTVTVGFLLGHQDRWSLVSPWAVPTLYWAGLGIVLVAAGSSAINQWIERLTDARMRRTRERPLPAGRLSPGEVLAFAFGSAIAGVLVLALFVNLLTAGLTALTFVLYALVYTPLKRRTSLCTALGAIPGALPPVLGWTAAGQPLDLTAFALFGLLFFWQFPHFLAIAWLHRDDYAAAGLRMLPGVQPLPRVTGLMATGYALGLVPISLIPAWLGLAGTWYAVTAVVLGLAYIIASIDFARRESRLTARRVLWTSLVYLPVVLATLAGDHWRLLR
jgi:protoheme IX farnesyltransferase